MPPSGSLRGSVVEKLRELKSEKSNVASAVTGRSEGSTTVRVRSAEPAVYSSDSATDRVITVVPGPTTVSQGLLVISAVATSELLEDTSGVVK